MVEDRTLNGRIFAFINYLLLSVISLVTVLPFMHVVAGSFTTSAELAVKRFVLIPTEWSF